MGEDSSPRHSWLLAGGVEKTTGRKMIQVSGPLREMSRSQDQQTRKDLTAGKEEDASGQDGIPGEEDGKLKAVDPAEKPGMFMVPSLSSEQKCPPPPFLDHPSSSSKPTSPSPSLSASSSPSPSCWPSVEETDQETESLSVTPASLPSTRERKNSLVPLSSSLSSPPPPPPDGCQRP